MLTSRQLKKVTKKILRKLEPNQEYRFHELYTQITGDTDRENINQCLDEMEKLTWITHKILPSTIADQPPFKIIRLTSFGQNIKLENKWKKLTTWIIAITGIISLLITGAQILINNCELKALDLRVRELEIKNSKLEVQIKEHSATLDSLIHQLKKHVSAKDSLSKSIPSKK